MIRLVRIPEQEVPVTPEKAAGMEKRKRISSAVASAVLVAVVAFSLFVMVQIFSRGYASVAGYSVFHVVTGSMEPTIPTGALLLCHAEPFEQTKENDIICFRSKEQGMLGNMITHRVIAISEDEHGQIYLRTKGDANLSEDGYYVTKENFVGRVMWHTGDNSALSAFVSFMNNKIGFLSIIVIPLLLVASFILKDNVKALGKAIEDLKTKVGDEDGDDRESLEDLKKQIEERKSPQLSEEEYKEMYARVKAQLLKEMEQEEENASADDREDGGASV